MKSEPDHRDYQDSDLVNRLALGDTRSLEVISERHARPAFALAYRILGDSGWAEELVQDVLLRLWRKPELYDPARGDLRRWLLTVTHHAAIDALRSRRGTARNLEAGPMALDGLAYNSDDPFESAWTAARIREVKNALDQLPIEQKKVIELAYYEGLSQTEIAARTNQALGTVKTRMRLGLNKLKVFLQQTGAYE